MAATAVKPPTGEIGVDLVGAIPSWSALGVRSGTAPRGPSVDREYEGAWRWPTSVTTVEKLANDTQIAGLYRGTTLPVRRYIWGIDPNGARPEVVDAVRAEFNLELIDDAWQAFVTGKSSPQPRARNQFSFDRHLTDALKAPKYGHYYFEKVGGYYPGFTTQDGAFVPVNVDDGRWHLHRLAARAPWTIGNIWAAPNGDLQAIKQAVGLQASELEAVRLVPYIFEQDPGDWTGRSLFRPCYREWLSKDALLRIDVVNHEKAGGILLTEAPKDATAAEIEALGKLAAAARVGGGGALPNGATPVFIRGTGSDIIGSINRHDEAMARVFLMMFMSLGTSSSGGNRALAGSFLDWFAIAQEAMAIWFRDVFNERVIRDYVDWSWGDQDEYLPKLVFKRPEAANPLDQLAAAVNQPVGDPGAVGYQSPDGQVIPVAAVRFNARGWSPQQPIVVDEETRAAINAAHADWEAAERPKGRTTVDVGRAPTRAALPDAAMPLPDRDLRREPSPVELAAQVNFQQIDQNWQSHADALVAQWQAIRAKQISELGDLIAAADGNLTTLALIQATATGGDVIAAQLKTMAAVGSQEALGEASRQGVAVSAPDLSSIEDELAARAAALEQLLARSLSEAAARRAVALSGGALTPSEVATATTTSLAALADTYLTDQFGGALAAAQNAGRMAAMDTNGASRLYASELLDVNTCEFCASVDGTEYASADAAAADYPAGGYKDCAGGPRCRGTIVAVYDEAAPTEGEA